MDLTALFIAALVIGPALGLVIWTRRCMARVEEELRAFSDFGGPPLDSGPRAPRGDQAAPWPLPG